jgi:hypothetical protein
MTKKRDWHRLNRSEDPFDIELDIINWTVRARKDKNTPWEYRKAYSFKHGLTTAEHIIYEQQKK